MEQVGVKLIGYFIVSVCLAILIGCFVTPEWLKACGMLFGAIYIYDAVFVEEGNYNSYTLWTVKCTKCGTALFRSFTQKSIAMNMWNDRPACVRYGKVMP